MLGALPWRRQHARCADREHGPYRAAPNAEPGRQAGDRRAIAAELPAECSLILNIGTTTEAVARGAGAAPGPARDRRTTSTWPRRCATTRAASSSSPAASCAPRTAASSARPRSSSSRQFRADIAVIGISSIEVDGGPARLRSTARSRCARAILQRTRQVWLAADHNEVPSACDGAGRAPAAGAAPVHRRPVAAEFEPLMAAAGVDVVVAPAVSR